MPVTQGVDYYDITGLLAEEEVLVRDTVREFVEDEVLPIIEKHNRAGTFPIALVEKMAELGMFGSTLPAKYGCAEMNNVAYGLVMQELERGDSGVRSFASVQSALVMYPIYTFGSEAQKDLWLPKLASGKKIGCFGLTEPDFGSNPAGMRTRAKRECSQEPIDGRLRRHIAQHVVGQQLERPRLEGSQCRRGHR